MLNNQVTRAGTLLYKGGIIYIDGWELKEPAMCREHVIFACMYVAKQLYEAAMENIREPGGASNTVADMPRETPREWLCDSTREFLEMFDACDTCEHQFEPDPRIPTHETCVKCRLCRAKRTPELGKGDGND
jgi:hypothetical protein